MVGAWVHNGALCYAFHVKINGGDFTEVLSVSIDGVLSKPLCVMRGHLFLKMASDDWIVLSNVSSLVIVHRMRDWIPIYITQELKKNLVGVGLSKVAMLMFQSESDNVVLQTIEANRCMSSREVNINRHATYLVSGSHVVMGLKSDDDLYTLNIGRGEQSSVTFTFEFNDIETPILKCFDVWSEKILATGWDNGHIVLCSVDKPNDPPLIMEGNYYSSICFIRMLPSDGNVWVISVARGPSGDVAHVNKIEFNNTADAESHISTHLISTIPLECSCGDHFYVLPSPMRLYFPVKRDINVTLAELNIDVGVFKNAKRSPSLCWNKFGSDFSVHWGSNKKKACLRWWNMPTGLLENNGITVETTTTILDVVASNFPTLLILGQREMGEGGRLVFEVYSGNKFPKFIGERCINRFPGVLAISELSSTHGIFIAYSESLYGVLRVSNLRKIGDRGTQEWEWVDLRVESEGVVKWDKVSFGKKKIIGVSKGVVYTSSLGDTIDFKACFNTRGFTNPVYSLNTDESEVVVTAGVDLNRYNLSIEGSGCYNGGGICLGDEFGHFSILPTLPTNAYVECSPSTLWFDPPLLADDSVVDVEIFDNEILVLTRLGLYAFDPNEDKQIASYFFSTPGDGRGVLTKDFMAFISEGGECVVLALKKGNLGTRRTRGMLDK